MEKIIKASFILIVIAQLWNQSGSVLRDPSKTSVDHEWFAKEAVQVREPEQRATYSYRKCKKGYTCIQNSALENQCISKECKYCIKKDRQCNKEYSPLQPLLGCCGAENDNSGIGKIVSIYKKEPLECRVTVDEDTNRCLPVNACTKYDDVIACTDSDGYILDGFIKCTGSKRNTARSCRNPSVDCGLTDHPCSSSRPCCNGLECNSVTNSCKRICRESGQTCETTSQCCSREHKKKLRCRSVFIAPLKCV